MFEIKLNIIPFGNKQDEHTVGKITIINDGTGNKQVGNYTYTVEDNNTIIAKGEIKDFIRPNGIFLLLKKVLNHAF